MSFAVPFWAGQLIVVLGWLLFRFVRCRKTKVFNWKSEAIQLLFLVNLLVIYRMTFHPFEKLYGKVQPLLYESATAWPFRMNLVPFVNLTDYETRSSMLLNLIGNTAMFIPTGILTPLIYNRKFFGTMLTGFLISLTIEIIQLPFAVRASDVDDLILNTLGCLIGYILYALMRALHKKK